MPDAVTTTLTRGVILAAAMQEFSRRGIADTPVEDLLVAAKIARRTFYRYFRSKEDVVAALYEISCNELLKAMEAAASRDHGEPLAGIHLGIDTYLEFHKSSARGLRELLEQAFHSGSLLAPLRRRMRDELVRIFDQSVRRLDGRALDPLVYYMLVSALEGLSLHVLDGGARPAEIERARVVVHALVDQVLGVPGGRTLPVLSAGAAAAR
jgi:AcrR family transcriptional regulator